MADQRAEFAFIDWIREQSAQTLSRQPGMLIGIGDDTAVFQPGNQNWLSTVDVLTEGVHFESTTPPELIGRKAINVNVSDIAAMAGDPVMAFVGVVFPRSWSRDQAQKLYEGLLTAANEWNVCLAGGDTNSWEGPLVLSVTLLGKVTNQQAVTRAEAQPGDWIFVSGPLGGSFPSSRHLTFTPRVREAQELHQLVNLHAMMDISDGLASDLFHIADQSRVVARIEGESVPVHADVPAQLSAEQRLHHALSDGEDFELLFTVSAEDGQKLLTEKLLSFPVYKIGEIQFEKRSVEKRPVGQSQLAAIPSADENESESGVLLSFEGKVSPLNRGGWSHQFGGRDDADTAGQLADEMN